MFRRNPDLLHREELGTEDSADVGALARVFAWVVEDPEQLVSLCQAVPEDQAVALLNGYVRHDLSDDDVLLAVAERPETFALLPFDSGWAEVVVWRYGSVLLNRHPEKKFTIEELAPLGLHVERATLRAVLGTAFDEGQLSQAEWRRLLEIFPNDSYFSAALSERGFTG
jgi:hypothetical protein